MPPNVAETIRMPAPDPAAAPQRWRETVSAAHPPGQTIVVGASGARDQSDGSPLNHASGITLGPELGRGGFGVVNAATQEVFARRVAVKRLLSTSAGDEARKFFAEAIVTASLQHPNVVPIYDLTLDGDRRLQLVMKCVEGVAWSDLLDPKRPEHASRAAQMTREDHLDILVKVSDAVAFAHGRGILHRDLKPENVMVGAYGEVQVMDWGCAVAFGDAPNHEAIPRVEAISQIAGTPSYMAPEMAIANPSDVGPHTDVYLLGGVLYEILTGTRPHRADDVFGVLASVVAGKIEPPNERAPDRGIPDELAWIAMAALTKDPRERTPSVDAFARQVKEYRAHSQAMLLTTTAKEHLDSAQSDPGGAEEWLRRAMAAADNAVELWPERTAGLRVQLAATLAYAEHALQCGSYASAITVSERARSLAAAASAAEETTRAQAITAEARAISAAHSARHRQLHVMRIALGVAAVVLVTGLSVGITMIASGQRRTASALAEAHAAISSLQAEREQRRQDQHRAAPGLVAQARAAISDKRLADAEQIAGIARGFDPGLASAHALVACLCAARGDYQAAAKAAAHWGACAPGQRDSADLEALCARAMACGTDLPPELTMGFGELFSRLQLYALAEGRMLRAEDRLGIYASRLDKAWANSGKNVQLTPRGMLATRENSALATDISDISPLAGMPFEALCLKDADVFDLAPLAGMPLRTLDIGGTKVKQLSSLAALPLERLNIESTEISDLTPIAALRLKRFNASRCQHLSDLSPLAGMPLEDVTLSGSAVTAIGALTGAPVTQLNIGGCQITDLSPIATMPLEAFSADKSSLSDEAMRFLAGKRLQYLNIAGTSVRDLAVIAGMPLRTLNVLGTRITDFSPIRALPLTLFFASHTAFSDTRLLSGMPLKTLWLDATGIGSIREVHGMPLSQLSIGFTTVADLGPLSGCSTLTDLTIHDTQVADLKPLRGMKLAKLDASGTRIADLAPLAGMPLTSLGVGTTRVKDLSALAGMPLRQLSVDHCEVTDYGPLSAFPLEVVTIGPFKNKSYAGIDKLRQHPTLKTIAVYSTAKEEWTPMSPHDFWMKYDAHELE